MMYNRANITVGVKIFDHGSPKVLLTLILHGKKELLKILTS